MTDDNPLRGLTPADGPAYYAALKPRTVVAWPEKDPPPEVTNRDPRPDDASPEPAAIRTLVRLAAECGFATRVGYSRGPIRAQATGTYKRVECFGVWAGEHPDTGWRFCAMYEQTIGTTSGFKWSRVTMWHKDAKPCGTSGMLRFTHASRTDLTEFIKARGRVLPSWFDAIAKRVADQKEKQREAAKARPAKKKEAN